VSGLWVVSLRTLRHRARRYSLTAAGVGLGVAVLFAVLVLNGSTQHALARLVGRSTSSADVFVNPAGLKDTALADDIPMRAAALPEVVAVSPDVVVAGGIGGPRSEQVGIIGSDPSATARVGAFRLSSGRFGTPGASEAALPETLARRLRLSVGSTVPLDVPTGRAEVTVVGLVADEAGTDIANAGNKVFVSITTAERLAGRAGFRDVELRLAPGTDPAAWVRAHQGDLGPTVVVDAASSAAAGFRSFVAAVNGALTLVSAIALFVGGFLIFLTFSIAIAEQTPFYGTLRALGAQPRQVRRLVTTEAAALGAVSSLGGISVGYVLAAAGVRIVSSLLHLPLGGVGVPLRPAVVSVVSGIVVSVVAASVPARRAARLAPTEAMRTGGIVDERPARPWAGAAVLLVGLVLARVGGPDAVTSVAALLVLLGSVLLVPWLLRPMAAAVGALTGRAGGRLGGTAVMHLVKERSRSGYTLALVMVVLAMVLSVAGSNAAMSSLLERVLDRQAAADLQVFAPDSFSPAATQTLASTPGVGRLSPIRFGTTAVQTADGPLRDGVTMIDPASYFDVAGFAWSDGDDASARAALAQGGAVLLGESDARRLGHRRGDTVSLQTPTGLHDFRVAGTYAVIGEGFGIVAGVADGGVLGATANANAYLVSTARGASAESVQTAVLHRLPREHLYVQTSEAAKAQARAQLRGFFGLAYALLVVATVVGMLGLANTLIVSILARVREIGVQRTVGALPRQVRRLVLVEALTLAGVAIALAVPLSLELTAGIVRGQRATLGFSVEFQYPWATVVPVAALALLVAAAVSVRPARRASGIPIVEALRFD
jgi:putative ABC transport system permease protein